MSNIIKLKRGNSNNIDNINLQEGELALATDTNRLYSKDGLLKSNVQVGTTAPTDESVDIWVNPQGTIDMSALWNQIYPVGSVYFSVNNTNPSVLFGGTWSQITGYYLYAGTGGNTGGSSTSGGPSNNTSGSTAITIAQMPSHNHAHSQWLMNGEGASGAHYGYGYQMNTGTLITNEHATNSGEVQFGNYPTGGGQGHTHTLSSHTHTVNPPKFELYCWKRIS